MRVLVPLDGTQVGERACPTIAGLMRLIDADVLLMHVIRPHEVHGRFSSSQRQGDSLAPLGTPMGQRLPVEEPLPRPAEDRSQAFARVHSEREDYLRDVAARYFGGCRVEVLVVGDEHPARAIVECARKHEVDGVAMATRGRAGLAHTLFGSVAEAVIRESPVPVLVVGPKAVSG